MLEKTTLNGLVIYPTETAYAIGCDATNQRAVDLIFKIKKRPKNKPLPLIASSLAMVKKYCRLSEGEEKLARQYWPGPLTMILNIKYSILNIKYFARGVASKDGTIAVRVSSHPVARSLSKKLGRPIVSTSANLSGEGEAYKIEDLRFKIKRLKDYKILMIDGGRLPKRKPSTIIRVNKGRKIEILRQGAIKILDIGY